MLIKSLVIAIYIIINAICHAETHPHNPNSADFYERLGVRRNADFAAIKAAYVRLRKHYSQNPEDLHNLQQVGEAFNELRRKNIENISDSLWKRLFPGLSLEELLNAEKTKKDSAYEKAFAYLLHQPNAIEDFLFPPAGSKSFSERSGERSLAYVDFEDFVLKKYSKILTTSNRSLMREDLISLLSNALIEEPRQRRVRAAEILERLDFFKSSTLENAILIFLKKFDNQEDYHHVHLILYKLLPKSSAEFRIRFLEIAGNIEPDLGFGLIMYFLNEDQRLSLKELEKIEQIMHKTKNAQLQRTAANILLLHKFEVENALSTIKNQFRNSQLEVRKRVFAAFDLMTLGEDLVEVEKFLIKKLRDPTAAETVVRVIMGVPKGLTPNLVANLMSMETHDSEVIRKNPIFKQIGVTISSIKDKNPTLYEKAKKIQSIKPCEIDFSLLLPVKQ